MGAIERTPNGLAHILLSQQETTPRLSPPEFYDALALLLRGIQQRVVSQGLSLEKIAAIAHPGRFLADGTLASGTTPNLGQAFGEFDGLSPADELKQRLGCRVFVENDAVSQMRFGLDILLRDPAVRPSLLGQTIVYLGIGTGLGAGVSQVQANGKITVVTDGHLFDMCVPGYGQGDKIAEELLTGPAIAGRIKEANLSLSAPINPPTPERISTLITDATALPQHQQVAHQIAEMEGDILAAIIEAIHAGEIKKVRLEPQPGGPFLRHLDEPDRAWSFTDRLIVKGASRFILGGSVGSNSILGAAIQKQALLGLRQRGLEKIKIFQIPANSADAGLLGVVHAVSEEIL
ncbi:MAG: ROK family protein [Candidatus Omnitrophica bacterium]|nr:ROK family protein [Candidatus Omnitrophota bacterium]